MANKKRGEDILQMIRSTMNKVDDIVHNHTRTKSIDQLDNFELMQELYYCVKGGDDMPSDTRDEFRLLYWELYDRVLPPVDQGDMH